MIGRAPVQSFPVYAPSFPAPPPQAFMQQPAAPAANWAPQPSPWPGQAPALAQRSDPPRPVVRGQMAEAPAEVHVASRPAPLAMPSPDQLGLGLGRPAALDTAAGAVDWNAALLKARRLGATGFNLNRLPEGGFQVVLLLPTGEADRHQHIEASAATEAGAVRLALERADLWANRAR